jgi:hypothetical protein
MSQMFLSSFISLRANQKPASETGISRKDKDTCAQESFSIRCSRASTKYAVTTKPVTIVVALRLRCRKWLQYVHAR